MIIAVEGCAHGELEKIYDTIKYLESSEQTKVDLLICCGDFQSTRNKDDLECMACPPKYRHICTFYKYYSGEKVAPILTIFIGGNHEASNYLQELPYGGWVAPNIYYMGYASIIKVAGIRIGGISGIYKGHDFLKGHFEIAPFNNDSMRSVYHIRNLEVFRLKQLTDHIDIFLSHDWPRGVYNYGNKSKLFKKKPYFREDVEMNKLGSKPCEDLLNHLKPSYWFAAHLHCKFSALIEHKTVDDTECKTKFLALDKCLPRRNFLQIVTVPHDMKCPIELNYDLEWLTILYLTNHLLSTKNCFSYMPTETSYERWNFTPTEEEKDFVHKKFNYNLLIPKNFTQTAKCYDPENPTLKGFQPNGQTNPQTDLLCEKLCIDDPLRLVLMNLNPKKDLSFNETLPNYLTPERETNKTYNESLNNLSDISPIKSFSFIPRSIEINTPSSKRTSLNLPKPKLVCSEPEGVLNSSSPAIKNSVSKSETSKSMSGEQFGACDFFIDNQPCRTDNEMHVSTYSLNKSVICESDKMSTSTPQPQKKFKKRNAAIYNSVDD